MKFRVERNFLVRTEEYIEINPEDFLHCANIEELNNEVEEYVNDLCEHPKHPNLIYSEEVGCRFHDYYFENNEESFYTKWQELKGLPQQL